MRPILSCVLLASMASDTFAVSLSHAKKGLVPRQETQKSEVANLLAGLGNSPHKILNLGQPFEGKHSDSEDHDKRQLSTVLSTLKSIADGVSIGGEDQHTDDSTGESGFPER